jgi:deaminated glutathione amidase
MSRPLTVACVQLRSTRSLDENITKASSLISKAAALGAAYIQTPENTGMMEADTKLLLKKAENEETSQSLSAYKSLAREKGIHLHIGSLHIKTPDGRVANRAYIIGPEGEILSSYDKIHMFDVNLGGGESYKESATFRPGTKACIATLPFAKVGITICYDLRFAPLFRKLAQSGAEIIATPAAFTKTTGEMHWHVLQRARAIETGSFIVASGQGGLHENGRETFGHSMIIAPNGRVLAEAGIDPCVITADIDLDEVEEARARIPAVRLDQEFTLSS